MATQKLLLLPGDGIGPEVMGEVKRLIGWLNKQGIASFETEDGLVDGAAYDASKQIITDGTMEKAKAADAIIFGAVGGPKWDAVPYEARPEAGLLRLRKDLGLFATLRPAVCYPALAGAGTLCPGGRPRRPASGGCARISACSRTYVPPCAIRRWRTLPA